MFRFLPSQLSKLGYKTLENEPENAQKTGQMKGRFVRRYTQQILNYILKTFKLNDDAVSLSTRKSTNHSKPDAYNIYLSSKAFDGSIWWHLFSFKGDQEISKGIDELSQAATGRDIEKVTWHLLHLSQLIASARKDIATQDNPHLLMTRKNRNDPVVTSPRIVPENEADPNNTTLQLNTLRTDVLDRVQDAIDSTADVIGPGYELKALNKLKLSLIENKITRQQFEAKASLHIEKLKIKSFILAPLARSHHQQLRDQCSIWRDQIDKMIK